MLKKNILTGLKYAEMYRETYEAAINAVRSCELTIEDQNDVLGKIHFNVTGLSLLDVETYFTALK